MPLDQVVMLEAARRLGTAERIMVISHIRPDGDAVGSALGLGLALQAAGKDVQIILEEGVPANYRHLDGSSQVRRKPKGEFDCICVLDCSDLDRAGKALKDRGVPDLNMDHHVTNVGFARNNLVDIQAVATAEIVADFLPVSGLSLTAPVAAALLTGLITDTIGFRTSNMTPKALRLAAALMETGIDLPDLYRRALVTRPLEAMRLWGVGLNNLERNGRMVWTTLSLADRAKAGYPGRDDADLVNLLVAIEGVDVFVVFLEQPNGSIKVSWRAQPGVDVSGLALIHGGGGHAAASGAEIHGSLSDVQAQVLQETRYMLGEE